MAKLWNLNLTEKPIVLDIETYDPNIDSLGPGVYHDKEVGACVLGCGVLDTQTGMRHYYPLHHNDAASEREQLAPILASERPKVLANGAYDLDWLENGEGLPVNGFIHDIQIAEPLLNPYRFSYSLQALSEYYNVQGKQTVDITRYAKELDPNCKSPQKLLYLMPCKVVGEYCCGDLDATKAVLQRQLPLLEKEELLALYKLECDMVRIRLMMRRNGILIDKNAVTSSRATVLEMESELVAKITQQYGAVNINSSAQLAPLLLQEGVKLAKTKTGVYSVDKEVLAKNSHIPLCRDLARARQLNKLRTTFLEKSYEEHICPDGRYHGEFYQLKRDEGGTITGRWSSQNPNLQQIPRNDKELGALCRSMFLPEEGCWYGHTDYSQIEYRVFSHYARGYKDGDEFDVLAQQMRDKFNADPDTDYHQYVIDLVKEKTGVELDRPTAKRVNFGTLYFMGVASLSKKFNIPYDEAQEVYDALFQALPFIIPTRQRVVNTAKMRGYVKTILGRRQRVGPDHLKFEKFYPFFNYEIQGTAADVMKKSLQINYEQGVYDVLKLHLLVHDETGTSIPKTREGVEAYWQQKVNMQEAVKFKIPIVAGADYGPHWGKMLVEDMKSLDEMMVMLK